MQYTHFFLSFFRCPRVLWRKLTHHFSFKFFHLGMGFHWVPYRHLYRLGIRCFCCSRIYHHEGWSSCYRPLPHQIRIQRFADFPLCIHDRKYHRFISLQTIDSIIFEYDHVITKSMNQLKKCLYFFSRLKLVWLHTETDTEFVVMLTMQPTLPWQIFFGSSMFPKFGISGTPFSSFLERSGDSFHSFMFTIISPSFCSIGSMLTRNSTEMYTLPLYWTDSSTLLCTHTTSSVCILRFLRLEGTCPSGGNLLWLSCNWPNLLPWWARQFTFWLTANALDTASGLQLPTLFTSWLFSSSSLNSLLHLTWSPRKRRRLKKYN